MKEELTLDKYCDCGKKLADDEIESYGYSCNECEKEVATMHLHDKQPINNGEMG